MAIYLQTGMPLSIHFGEAGHVLNFQVSLCKLFLKKLSKYKCRFAKHCLRVRKPGLFSGGKALIVPDENVTLMASVYLYNLQLSTSLLKSFISILK